MNGAKITFFGNLTQDPELNYASQSAKPYTKARIAVNTYLGQDKEDQSDFYNLTWFYNAEDVANRFQKGDRIYIEGSFKPDYYIANNGESRMGLSIIVRDYAFVSKPKGRDQTQDDYPMATEGEPTDIPPDAPGDDEDY